MLLLPIANAQESENAEVEQLADDLEFLMEEVAIYGENGNVVNFDFDMLEERFGYSVEFEMLKEEIDAYNATQENNSGEIQLFSWKSCMISALKDHFGVALVNVAINGGLWAYLEKKAYKEAAKLLVKIGIGGNLIGLTAFLSWYGVTCLDD
jgi:hypothetical protein